MLKDISLFGGANFTFYQKCKTSLLSANIPPYLKLSLDNICLEIFTFATYFLYLYFKQFLFCAT